VTGEAQEELGPYLIYEKLGSGGMATVHRAESRGVAGFRRVVALKRLLPHIAEDEAMVRSFVHEARLASHLHHTNVAQTYDLGKVEDTYFIAMEYFAGPTLTQVMRQCETAAGPMPIPIVMAILGQVCDALDHAHNLCDDSGKALGIIHRDVSPSNIIVSNTGIVKLIDFGIAKAATSDKTKTGLIKGKFAYLAPEYTAGILDLRADLFGVGVIAHELVTGRRLFEADSDYDTIMKLREMPIQPPSRWNPAISHDLDDIVMTALQRTPDLRWQSAAAMRTAITNASRTLGVVGHQQVREWIEWAFSQEKRTEDSGLARVIDMLAEPSSITVELSVEQVEELDQIPPPSPPPWIGRERAKPTAKIARARAESESGVLILPPRRRSRARPWLLLVVLLVVAAGAYYYFFEYEDYELTFELPFGLSP
jgi:serine/threonine protein kinase